MRPTIAKVAFGLLIALSLCAGAWCGKRLGIGAPLGVGLVVSVGIVATSIRERKRERQEDESRRLESEQNWRTIEGRVRALFDSFEEGEEFWNGKKPVGKRSER